MEGLPVIVERLQEHYKAKAVEEAEPFRFRPSGLGSCLREQAFLLGGMEPYPASPESMRTFELGHQRGLALETACKALWDDCQTQVPISIQAGKYALAGSCDVWIPSLRTVVDFKTIGGYGAGMLRGTLCKDCQGSGGYDGLEPCPYCKGTGAIGAEGVSEEYKLQLHAYRHGMARLAREISLYAPEGSVHFPHLIRCVVVYECKDSDARKGIQAGGLIELEVPYSDELEKRYQARLKEVELLLDLKEQGTLDPTLVAGLDKKHWRCRNHDDGTPRYCRVGSARGGCHK